MHVTTPTVRNIVLIDDDFDDFSIFEDALKEIDPTIRVCHIPNVEAVPAEGSFSVPDLLFLDINMPDKNGFEWLKCIRGKGIQLPVVMYSTASSPDQVEKAYKEGANVYFTKPDSFKILQESLKKLLTLNWLEPFKIRDLYCQGGEYKVFSPF